MRKGKGRRWTHTIDKVLVLLAALQYEREFVDWQNRIMGGVLGIITASASWGLFRLFCHLIATP